LANIFRNSASSAIKSQEFLDIFIITVIIIVIAIPENLPLTVILILAFIIIKIFKENNLIRIFRIYKIIENATTIYSDKIEILIQNKMIVVAGTLSDDEKFSISSIENERAFSFSNVFRKLSASFKDLLI
jgi:P-type Ca2+ transporter type 2C